MVEKHKGGKGKRAEYQTQVMRIPTKLGQVVQGLVEQFHQQRTIAVTGITVQEAYKIGQVTGEDATVWDACNLECKEEYLDELQWVVMEPQLAEYLTLADKANMAIRKMDSTWSGIGTADTIETLVRFRLIQAPLDITPASASQIAECMLKVNTHAIKNIDAVLVHAINTGQFDVFAALYQPEQLERQSYWHSYYQSKLGRFQENYWRWKANPESRDICPELTALLDKLPEPDGKAKQVLEHLGDDLNPFYKAPARKRQDENGMWCFEIPTHGAFHQYPYQYPYYDDGHREDILSSFINWYEQCCAVITGKPMADWDDQDLTELYRIMEVCFSCSRYRLEELRQVYMQGDAYWEDEQPDGCWSILGVKKNASKHAIKSAYKNLAKSCHPDVSNDTDAKAQFIRLNTAYEEAMELAA